MTLAKLFTKGNQTLHTMSVIHSLLGRDDTFYRFLESSASQSEQSVQFLREVVRRTMSSTQDVQSALGDLNQSRRKHKRITQEITEALCTNFITPLEREDIEALSGALYRISKTVEKIGERVLLCPPGAHIETVNDQVTLLEQGVSVLTKMVGELRAKSHSETIRDNYERVQAIEGDADRVMNKLLNDLYHGQADAREVVFLKDIYELLEKGIDRCRDAAASLFQTVLKNS